MNWFCKFDTWECGMAFSMEACFEEAYEIKAALITARVLGLEHGMDVAHAFCDLTVKSQGLTEKDMFYMGYGNQVNKDGIPACSCVADAGSVAQALIETVQAYPDSSKNDKYIDSVRRYLDYVLANYTTEEGVIGVGILGHKINPMKEYWCANSLFAASLIGFAEVTGEEKYMEAAVAPLEYMATFDYKNTDWKEWEACPQQIILYSSESILKALSSEIMKEQLNCAPRISKADTSPGCNDALIEQALNKVTADKEDRLTRGSTETVRELLLSRWQEFADWLLRNQEVNGVWKTPNTRGYRTYEPGLSWIIYKACKTTGADEKLEALVERQLAYLISQEAKSYFSLFCKPFPTALAHLSFAFVAEDCMKHDQELFKEELAQAQRYSVENLW